MFLDSLTTDCNGFAIFDPAVLEATIGRPLEREENLLIQLQRGELGDKVLAEGAIVPIYPLTDALYTVCVRTSAERAPDFAVPNNLYGSTGVYPLCVRGTPVLADLAVIQEWWPEEGWHHLDLPKGFHSVRIDAYYGPPSGLDVVLTPSRVLPIRTATWDANIDIGNPRH